MAESLTWDCHTALLSKLHGVFIFQIITRLMLRCTQRRFETGYHFVVPLIVGEGPAIGGVRP